MEDILAVLGCGNMGEILAEGLIGSGSFQPKQIVATARRPQRLQELEARLGLSVAQSNREAAEESDILVLAVKPADLPPLLSEIAQTVTRRHLVISIAAGVTTASIYAGLPMAGPVVRAMPNVAARVRQSMTAIAGGERSGEPDIEKAESLFSSIGRVIRLPEHLMDAVTALSGSGPAFFAFFAEAMIRAGQKLNLTSRVSAELLSQTMLGVALLVQNAGMTPIEIMQAVTSPGGTTEAGIRRLEKDGVAGALESAVSAAAERASQLRQ